MKLVTKLAKLINLKTIKPLFIQNLIIKMTQIASDKTQLDDVTDEKKPTDSNNNELNLAQNKTTENDLIDLFETNLKLDNKLKLNLFESMDIAGAAKCLLKCKNVIFMTGAGISTSVFIEIIQK